MTGGGLVDACGSIQGFPDCDPRLTDGGGICAPACGDPQFNALDATHGGQVGAPIGVQTPFGPICDLKKGTTGSACIRGEWTHVRHIRPGLNGNFHARTFDSLECACLGCLHCSGDSTIGCNTNKDCPAGTGTCTGPLCPPALGPQTGVKDILCNDGDRICGPEPRRAPDNKICFSGVGDYVLSNGKRTGRAVVFRVDVIDRGEPGGTVKSPPPDHYRMRIWLVDQTAGHDALGDPDKDGTPAHDLRMAVACGAPFNDGVPSFTSVNDEQLAAIPPDIDDGGPYCSGEGDLIRGNQQIHPSLKKTCP